MTNLDNRRLKQETLMANTTLSGSLWNLL